MKVFCGKCAIICDPLADGGLHMLTPVDALFFILPTPAAAQQSSDGSFLELSDLLERHSQHQQNVVALSDVVTPEQLAAVCERKQAGGDNYFRY